MKKEQLELANAENIKENIDARKFACYGFDSDNNQWRRILVDKDGKVQCA